MEEISVANKRYFMFPVYVSFLTWNKAANRLPILVSGINKPIIIARKKATAKLIPIFTQLISAKLIVKTHESKFDEAIIAEVRQRKKQTGMLQIML